MAGRIVRGWPRRDACASEDRAPLHVTGEVLSAKKVGAYRHLTLVAPGIAERFRPGHVRRGLGRPDPRAATWPAALLDPPGPARPAATAPPSSSSSSRVGAGTRWLAGLAPGAPVEVTGPLGRPFALPKEPVACLLVGEGYAAAPLFPLAERLRERGCAVTAALAARRRGPPALRAGGPPLRPRRHRGHRRRLGRREGHRRRRDRRRGRAAPAPTSSTPPGPPRTLHAVAAAAERARRLEPDRAEPPLTCATGLCLGCPVPVVGEDGVARHGPRLRRRTGLPRRPGPLGRRWRGRPMTRPRRPRPDLPRCWSPPAAAAPAASSRRTATSPTSAASSPARSPSTPAPGGPAPRIVETPSGLVNADRAAEPRPRGLPRHRAAVAGRSTAPGSSCRSPARTLGEYAELARRLGRSPGVAGDRGQPVRRPTPPAPGVFDVREPFHAASVVGRGPPRPAARRCRCWPSSAPTWSGSSRPPARCSRPAPTRSSSATRCPPRCPTAGPAGSAARRSGRSRCAAWPRCTPRCPRPAWSGAGGIVDADDVRAFLAAGAAAVQIGTALLHDPTTAARVVADLRGAR